MGFVRVLIVEAPPHRCFYPLVDHTSVVNHTLEPPINDGGPRCHRPAWSRRDFRGITLAALGDRLPEVVWQESGEAIGNLTVRGGDPNILFFHPFHLRGHRIKVFCPPLGP